MLSDQVAQQNDLTDKIYIEPKGQTDEHIQKIYAQSWNSDNFGPLIIPEGKCFVIGDNRHNSVDSRYFGLIDASKVVGTVINK